MYPKTMILAVLMFSASAQAEITVTAWELRSTVIDGNGPDVFSVEETPPVTLPFNAVSPASDGPCKATSTYDFEVVGNVGSLGFEFDHRRGGTPSSLACSYIGPHLGYNSPFLTFSVSPDADLFYSLDGFYAMTGSSKIIMLVELWDLTTETVVFRNMQISHNTTNEAFRLGETDGDETNELIGSLTGALTAGHDYTLKYTIYIHLMGDDPDPGASAVGSVNLDITPCPPPSPCVADLDGNGVVDAADLAILLDAWGPCPDPPEPCPADLFCAGDGFVSGNDLAVLLGTWGPCKP